MRRTGGTDRQRLSHTCYRSIFAREAVVNQELIIHALLFENLTCEILKLRFRPIGRALERVSQDQELTGVFSRDIDAVVLYFHRWEQAEFRRCYFRERVAITIVVIHGHHRTNAEFRRHDFR